MSLKEHQGYSVVCDWPGCDADAQEGGDYASWEQADVALGEADSSGWYVGDEGEFCELHSHWDEEADELRPLPPGLDGEFMVAEERIRATIARGARLAEHRINKMASDARLRAEVSWAAAARKFGISQFDTRNAPGAISDYRPQLAV